MERQLLDGLYAHTFSSGTRACVVVLDIEVSLGQKAGKCDLVLYHTRERALLFVEGKVFSDGRVKCMRGFTPEVIAQAGLYSEAIARQEEDIVAQYANHIRVINELFHSSFETPLRLVRPAKLLVYETSLLTDNCVYSQETIDAALGRGNTLWCAVGERPLPEEIWQGLTK